MIGNLNQEEEYGIMPRAFEHIYQVINSTDQAEHKKYLVRCTFIEIYNEEIRDLLGKDTKKKHKIK